MSVKVTVNDNSAEVLKDLQRLQLKFVIEGGEKMRTDAYTLSPYDLGNLRNSIQTSPAVVDGIAECEIAPIAEYATYLEYGTRFQKAQPYMAPAWEKLKPWLRKREKDLTL
jgi:HK97 gp10 family phage protein